MAFVIWRAAMKKYTAVKWEIKRNHIGLIIPTKKAIKAREENTVGISQENQLETITATTSSAVVGPNSLQSNGTCESLCSSINPSVGSLDEILTHSQEVDLSRSAISLPRVDLRKSKSKMKSYLKRCKDKLIGPPVDDQHPITHHEPVSQNPTTSWYLDETEELVLSSPSVVNAECSDLLKNEKVVEISEVTSEILLESKDKEDLDLVNGNEKALDAEVTLPKPEDKLENSDTANPETISISGIEVVYDHSVENLVDRYLGHLYPDYLSETRTVLVRQARDILVLTYHGDASKFEFEYLLPAAKIVECLKLKYMQGWNQVWYNGWPLAISGAIVLHLGILDESLLRHHEIYLCIKSESDKCGPKLYAVWRSQRQSKIVYHPLDPDKDCLSPSAIEMLAEDLPQLLQSLLASVEREICRVPLDDLPFPTKDFQRDQPDENGNGQQQQQFDNRLLLSPSNGGGTPRRLECGIKRRELITKNNNINNKYMLKRIASTSVDDKSEIDINNKNMKNDLICGGDNKHLSTITSIATAQTTTTAPASGTLPTIINATQQIISLKPPASLDADSASQLNGETIASMPLFCLGGSFPHIDSDEESGDDTKKTETVSRLPHDIVAPRSIQDVPEKLLMSGILLLGTEDANGSPVITIKASGVLKSGLNCYEIATVLLYYNTIPIRTTTFTVHLILNESNHFNIVDLLDSSLQLLQDNVKFNIVLISGTYQVADKDRRNKLPKSLIHVKYVRTEYDKSEYLFSKQLPHKTDTSHDQKQWIEFFTGLEPLREQCLTVGSRLVAALSDIRVVDAQGTTTRRQLHSQHRALSRALMDTELQSLRRKGPNAIARLEERAARINTDKNNKKTTLNETKNQTTIQTEIAGLTGLNVDNNLNTPSILLATTTASTTIITTTTNPSPLLSHENDFVETRLNSVIMLFNEVDISAKRLEQITEQRRERLREMTRQRALEDEINEVIAWFKNDGNQSLTKYEEISLECGDTIKKHEQDFEKFYFISMKYLAKGKDLHGATKSIEMLQPAAIDLKGQMRDFSEQLENLREKIEGASRLHHLFGLKLKDDDVLHEMQKLADRIGVPELIERCKTIHASNNSINSCKKELALENLEFKIEKITASSTPEKMKTPPQPPTANSHLEFTKYSNKPPTACNCWQDNESQKAPVITLPPLIEDIDPELVKMKALKLTDEDEEDHSKMADSGLGGCDRCEGNGKLTRACSCQSFEDATIACDKSNNSDDMDEDCFENSNKPSLDLQAPLQTNAHLYCHASTLQLDMEDCNFLDQKTKKTLLLIMREMIGTERDYVRSLYYVIENYTKELLREDIPQALRGQRNVIFGNIEKIYEFHQQHFLTELESCEHDPLKIGAVFLRHESKFYLYALYNKNKPKSDSLMSEYGTVFFKSKQLELTDKMDLASYLLKPVQRMGKYALLLQQLMKACSNVQTTGSQEFIEDLEELQKAEEMVRFQLRHGNDLLAMDSLRDCDVNVKEQGRLLRQSEFLVWEGKGGKKSIRQVFLFEELVLFSKARRFPDRKNLDIYIYKNSIKTSDIGLTAHVGDSKTKFEIWFRKRKPGDTWTLQSMSEDVKNTWANEISNLLWNQAKRNREVRMAEMSSMGIGSKPCLDIRPSIDQINDRSISIFQLGKAPKFRNSFMGTLPEMKSSRRPNSIISLSSSSSSAGSSVSNSTGSSCGASLVSGDNKHNTSSNSSYDQSMIHHHVAGNNCNKHHHHRSTTIVSQCSMESGIIADISSFSPDEFPENPMWPSSLIKKSNSTSSADQNLNKHHNKLNSSHFDNDKQSTNSSPDSYLTDTITVHL